MSSEASSHNMASVHDTRVIEVEEGKNTHPPLEGRREKERAARPDEQHLFVELQKPSTRC